MKLIVGLGNPGVRYEGTRHNTGFMAVNLITSDDNSQNWQNRFESLIKFGNIGQKKVIFLKPSTYMNLSGISVQKVLNFYKIKTENTIVFHDDIDLPLGAVKLKEGGGHAGHNGLKSISKEVGESYLRVRIGVGRPKEEAVSNYVLSDFSDNDITILNQSLLKCCLGIKFLVNDKNEDCRTIFSKN